MLSLSRARLSFHTNISRVLIATRGIPQTASLNSQNHLHFGRINRNFTRNFTSGDESHKKEMIPTRSTSNMKSTLESGTINVVKVPNMGKNLKRCKIYKWFKKPGDYVNVDDLLCIIETDLIFGKVYSQVAGTVIENANHEGCTVSVGSDLAVLVNDDVVPNTFQESKVGGFGAEGKRHFSTGKYKPMISFAKLKSLMGREDTSLKTTTTESMGGTKLVGSDKPPEATRASEPQNQTQGPGPAQAVNPRTGKQPYVLDDFYKSPFRSWFRLVSEEEINLVNHGTVDPKDVLKK